MARIAIPQDAGSEMAAALALRPELADGVLAYTEAVRHHSGIDPRVHELVRMRVAQLNDCAFCMSWREPAGVEAGATEELLAAVADASTHPGFSERERVAIEYAERFCTDSAAIGDDLLERLERHFDPGEIVGLTLAIGKYVALGRFRQVLGLDQACVAAGTVASAAT